MTLDMHMLDIINKITVGLQILRELTSPSYLYNYKV